MVAAGEKEIRVSGCVMRKLAAVSGGLIHTTSTR
jgi:hypothetical protein